jgi:hypothetical protein
MSPNCRYKTDIRLLLDPWSSHGRRIASRIASRHDNRTIMLSQKRKKERKNRLRADRGQHAGERHEETGGIVHQVRM